MRSVGALFFVLLFCSEPSASQSGKMMFDVYLDDSRIGSHSYEIIREAGATTVSSKAQFDVKFLFITAYKYRHTVTERWSDGCLQSIEAETSANGKKQKVDGQEKSGNFVVEANGDERQLGDCVMTFAYWNPTFLNQPRLLNPQTGDYLPVEVTEVDVDAIDASRKKLGSSAYRLTAKDLEVTVWYSDSGEWVGLESAAKGGRMLRYEIA